MRRFLTLAIFGVFGIAGCGHVSTASPPLPMVARSGRTSPGSNASSNAFQLVFGFPPDASQGGNPFGALTAYEGALYGTTVYGGSGSCSSAAGCGTIFKLTPSVHGFTESVAYSFPGGTNAYPEDALLMVKGTFYGTSAFTVFTFSPSTFKLAVLHTFTGGNDGYNVAAGLAADRQGNLYGTTLEGGGTTACNLGCGTVFELSPHGKRYHYAILYRFKGKSDGSYPYAGVVVVGKRLFGTASSGGNAACNGGCGTVFELTPKGSKYAFHVVHAFSGGNDGSTPAGPLSLGAHGVLYGTTGTGGNGDPQFCASVGCGIAFELVPSGNAYREKILHVFNGSDGANPNGAILSYNGTLYGSAFAGGGTNGYGVVWSLKGNAFRNLYVFRSTGSAGANGPKGSQPRAGLIGLGGRLYGTASAGGGGAFPACNNGCGTIFSIAP